MTETQALAIVQAITAAGLTGETDADVAVALNGQLRSTMLTADELVQRVGLARGRTVLAALQTAAAGDAVIAAAIGVLTSGGKLDVGSAVVVEAVTELVNALALQPADAEAIAGLARRYGTLTAADVATARAVGALRSTYEAGLAADKATYDAAVAAELEA